MNVEAFFDTNVLVYAAVGGGKDETKRKRAMELVESIEFGTSAQVLQEFFVTVVKKASRPISATRALDWIEQWTAFPCQTIDHQLVRIAIERSERFAISYWDAAILAAAEALGTDTVYSEDLSHGQRYGRVRVINPFQ
ncbi:MAG: PIN domain-containing protein [Bryobacteraceae bacterium]